MKKTPGVYRWIWWWWVRYFPVCVNKSRKSGAEGASGKGFSRCRWGSWKSLRSIRWWEFCRGDQWDIHWGVHRVSRYMKPDRSPPPKIGPPTQYARAQCVVLGMIYRARLTALSRLTSNSLDREIHHAKKKPTRCLIDNLSIKWTFNLLYCNIRILLTLKK